MAVVHVRDVPRVPPLCDAFEGTKGWVDVGDVALYREEEGEGQGGAGREKCEPT